MACMAQLSGTEQALQAIAILEQWNEDTIHPMNGFESRRSTFLEERREAIQGIAELLGSAEIDEEALAVCAGLLVHLAAPVRGRCGLPS